MTTIYGIQDLRDEDELIIGCLTPEQLAELAEIERVYEAGALLPVARNESIPPLLICLIVALISVATLAALWT